MTQPNQPPDPDLAKGAIEGPPEDGAAQGNPNAPALDENGLPANDVAICQDVIGANEDGTVGD